MTGQTAGANLPELSVVRSPHAIRGTAGPPVSVCACRNCNGFRTPLGELEDLTMRLPRELEERIKEALRDLTQDPGAQQFAAIDRACSVVKKGLPHWQAVLFGAVRFLVL